MVARRELKILAGSDPSARPPAQSSYRTSRKRGARSPRIHHYPIKEICFYATHPYQEDDSDYAYSEIAARINYKEELHTIPICSLPVDTKVFLAEEQVRTYVESHLPEIAYLIGMSGLLVTPSQLRCQGYTVQVQEQ
jgi:hypothetical protein